MRARILATLPALLANRAAVPSTPIGELGRTTTETGRIFQSGGIDGLVLYALALSSFMLFLVCIFMLIHMRGSQKTNAAAFVAKDKAMKDLTDKFVESMDRASAAQSALAVSVAGDLQERAANRDTLRRMEETDSEIRGLLRKLNDVP